MLKQSVVDKLRNDWNERAAVLFMAAAEPDLAETEKHRQRGKAEQLALCAQELAKADAESAK